MQTYVIIKNTLKNLYMTYKNSKISKVVVKILIYVSKFQETLIYHQRHSIFNKYFKINLFLIHKVEIKKQTL